VARGRRGVHMVMGTRPHDEGRGPTGGGGMEVFNGEGGWEGGRG
jgi:hypothetical protein